MSVAGRGGGHAALVLSSAHLSWGEKASMKCIVSSYSFILLQSRTVAQPDTNRVSNSCGGARLPSDTITTAYCSGTNTRPDFLSLGGCNRRYLEIEQAVRKTKERFLIATFLLVLRSRFLSAWIPKTGNTIPHKSKSGSLSHTRKMRGLRHNRPLFATLSALASVLQMLR